jgi:uncharacterized protein
VIRSHRRGWSAALTAVALAWLTLWPLAGKAEADILVDSASVNAIKKSLADRLQILRAHFDAGTIGLTHDGMVALRDAAALTVEARAAIEALINDDNKDRNTLLREISRANNRPDWESGLRLTFAERWIKRAPAGWFIRQSSGKWMQKPAGAGSS